MEKTRAETMMDGRGNIFVNVRDLIMCLLTYGDDDGKIKDIIRNLTKLEKDFLSNFAEKKKY